MTEELDSEIINHIASLSSEYIDFLELKSSLQSLETIIEVDERFLKKPRDIELLPPNARLNLKNDINYFEKQIIDARYYIAKIKNEIKNFPTAPELPPTKPLIKISGVIDELTFKKVIGYFKPEEYSTEKEIAQKKRDRDNAGAVLLMITQLLSSTVVHATTNNGERKKYKCTYVTGKLEGKIFSGWLGKTNIQVGDYVEMAVMPDGDVYKMYAVANPQQRTISTTPSCEIGHANFSMQKTIMAVAKVLMTIAAIVILFSLDEGVESALNVLLFFGTISVVSGFFIHRGVVTDTRATSDLFERICTALEIPNGETLVLDIETKNKINELKRNGEWTAPDKETIPMPRTEFKYSDDYFFYY